MKTNIKDFDNGMDAFVDFISNVEKEIAKQEPDVLNSLQENPELYSLFDEFYSRNVPFDETATAIIETIRFNRPELLIR